jgi:hypothetical protein
VDAASRGGPSSPLRLVLSLWFVAVEKE